MRPILLSTIAVVIVACESGTGENHDITVDDAVATSFDADAPGLLRTEGAGELVAVLCGQTLDNPDRLWIDHGFGCLDDLKGTEASRTAWIEPMPESWDAAALCALPAPSPEWHGVSPGSDVIGHEGSFLDDLASDVDEAWFQGTGSGTWKRDASPCGGTLDVEIEIGG